MNKKQLSFFVVITISLFTSFLHSIEYKEIALLEISSNIQRYKNKTISLKLRLRNIDLVFDKIYFYDNKNHDITFDISTLKKKKLFKKIVLNLHEGMFYAVSFMVKDVGSLGEVIGELQNFEVIILNKIPEGK